MVDLIASLHLDTARWRHNSVLAPHIEAFAAYLREGRYAARTIKLYLHCIAHLARWLGQADRSLALADEALVEEFLGDHVAGCDCPAPAPRSPRDLHAACGHLLRVLRAYGGIHAPVMASGPIADELRGFSAASTTISPNDTVWVSARTVGSAGTHFYLVAPRIGAGMSAC